MKYSSLPLAANNFQMSDLGNDYIKICINDKPDCCVELEFNALASAYLIRTASFPKLAVLSIRTISY